MLDEDTPGGVGLVIMIVGVASHLRRGLFAGQIDHRQTLPGIGGGGLQQQR